MAQKQVRKPKEESKVEKAVDELVAAVEEVVGRKAPEFRKQMEHLRSLTMKEWQYVRFPTNYPQQLHNKLKQLGRALEEEGCDVQFEENSKYMGSLLMVEAPEPKESAPAKQARKPRDSKKVAAAIDELISETRKQDGSVPPELIRHLRDLVNGPTETRIFWFVAEGAQEIHKKLEGLYDLLIKQGYDSTHIPYNEDFGSLLVVNPEQAPKPPESKISRDSVPSKAICKAPVQMDYSEASWYKTAIPLSKSKGKFAALRTLLAEHEIADERLRKIAFEPLFKLYSDKEFSKEFQKKHALLQKKLKEIQTPKKRTRQEQAKLSMEIRALEADVAGYSKWVARMHAYATTAKNKEKLANATAELWIKKDSELKECKASEVSLLAGLYPLRLSKEQMHDIYLYLRNNTSPECEAAATIELGTGKDAERKAMALGELLRSYPQLNLNVYTVRTVDYLSEGKPAWRVELGADWATSKKRGETNSP